MGADKNQDNKHSESSAQETSKMTQLIVFRQGKEEYGIHIDQIKEVVLTPNITKMPQTPDYVKGVANIRGNIIGIVDLEEKFGLKDINSTQKANEVSNYTLVIESDTFKVGLLVTEVPNTLSVNVSAIERSVNLMGEQGSEEDYIQGIVKLDDRLIILIDVLRVLTDKELDSLATSQQVMQ